MLNNNQINIKKEGNITYVNAGDYNSKINMDNGYFERWGKTEADDPELAPMPEIADIEVTTACKGIDGKVCKFCYKSNTANGFNMSLETFKNVFHNVNQYGMLSQIAFGADSNATSNPELFDMMDYCRENGVVPNITVAQITEDTADKLVARCGAVAVSHYGEFERTKYFETINGDFFEISKQDYNKRKNEDGVFKDSYTHNPCYNTVKMLTDKGMDQVNIHQLLSQETYDQVLKLIDDRNKDPRLEKMNAIVFLSLKKRGRGEKFNSLTQEQFSNIVKKCLDMNVPFGFDSCSANKFTQCILDMKNENMELNDKVFNELRTLPLKPEYSERADYLRKTGMECVNRMRLFDQFLINTEPCESSAFSIYVSNFGRVYPCSFAEGIGDWKQGIDISKEVIDFKKEVWDGEKLMEFREKLLCEKDCNSCRKCQLFEV